MKGFEFSHGPSTPRDEVPRATAEDFSNNEKLSRALNRLPLELRNAHAATMGDLDDTEALSYIESVLSKRESAMRESVVSDESLEPYFTAHEDEIWNDLETRVFSDESNNLGSGQTARIKRYELHAHDTNNDMDIDLAVKYLLTPSEKTLSVSGEHDLIREVERVRAIEVAERVHEGTIPHFKVPHPYFYYKNGKIQCYAMERIDGINLEEGIQGAMDESMRAQLRTALAGISRQALEAEVELFFNAMHTVCLHGDIKPANMMISKEGQFYVIDFGQSVLANDINDKAIEAFEVLKEDEKSGARTAINHFLKALEII